MRSTATRSRTTPAIRQRGPDPVLRLHGPDGAALRTGDRDAFSSTIEARRAQRRNLQRAGAGLRADRLSDPGRPGAAIGPELPGQSLDVPGRRRRRAPAADPSPLCSSESDDALFPILVERTSVRLDLSHSGWSDIFFLGMDFPEGARVLNISVDLGVHGRDARAHSADRVPAAGDHRADPAPDQHRSERVQGRRQPGRAVQLRQRLPGPGQGGRGRLGPGPPCPRGNAVRGSPICWPGSSGPGTGWRSSARSTTFPRVRGWPSRPTCWLR